MNLKNALQSVHSFARKEALVPLSTVWGEQLDPEHILEEYPRPQLVRDNYINLNGYWNYKILKKDKNKISQLQGKILVPFSPEAPLSGVNHQLLPSETLICERKLPELQFPGKGYHCILHFGAVDQFCQVSVNGETVTTHLGGYLPFSVDITSQLHEQDNVLTVQIEDHSDRSFQSVGKQKLKRGGMFYTAQSGIWQTVWLEWVPPVYITDLEITPLFDKETIHISVSLNSARCNCCASTSVVCNVYDSEDNLVSKSVCTNSSSGLCQFSCYCDVNDMHPWTPDDPYLYTLKVFAGEDEVTGYFAMRTFTIEKDTSGISRFCLNHEPVFLNGVLDQGYWPDGLYTAPSDEALIYDIQSMKNLGFNMLRKHAKIESARWYYHCDRLGMIVWQDMVNGGGYSAPLMTWLPTLWPPFRTKFTDKLYPLLGRKDSHGREQFVQECRSTIQALHAFPCISTWVIFNEGWGQFDSKKLTKMFRELDDMRLIDTASGWFDKGYGDFKSEHNYFSKQHVIADKRAYVISELGGYACPVKKHLSTTHVYGYRVHKNLTDFQSAYNKLMNQEIEPLISQGLCGTIYTQVSDIEDEVNGILTYDRKICKLKNDAK